MTTIDETAFQNSPNVTVLCDTDSYAHTFAEDSGIAFTLIDAPKKGYYLGDADLDDCVSIFDATHIQRILAELEDDPDGESSKRGDVDFNGIDIFDVTKIQRWLAHFEDADPRIGTIIYV